MYTFITSLNPINLFFLLLLTHCFLTSNTCMQQNRSLPLSLKHVASFISFCCWVWWLATIKWITEINWIQTHTYSTDRHIYIYINIFFFLISLNVHVDQGTTYISASNLVLSTEVLDGGRSLASPVSGDAVWKPSNLKATKAKLWPFTKMVFIAASLTRWRLTANLGPF